MRLEPHDRLVVLGITGAGKSHFVAHDIIATHKRVVAWDPHGEYSRDYQVARPCTLDKFAGLSARAMDMESLHLSVIARWDDEDELADAFADFVRHCKACVRDAVIVVEECAILTTRAQRSLAMLATQARHWDCPMVMVAQRFVHITPSARGQMSRLASFRQTSKDDIAELRGQVGDKADEIASLPRWQAVHWSEADAFAGG